VQALARYINSAFHKPSYRTKIRAGDDDDAGLTGLCVLDGHRRSRLYRGKHSTNNFLEANVPEECEGQRPSLVETIKPLLLLDSMQFSVKHCAALFAQTPVIFHKLPYAPTFCSSNIEMAPLCKVEVTLPRVLGSRRMRRGGGVDEHAGVQPA
jgi:hypothetical protein